MRHPQGGGAGGNGVLGRALVEGVSKVGSLGNGPECDELGKDPGPVGKGTGRGSALGRAGRAGASERSRGEGPGCSGVCRGQGVVSWWGPQCGDLRVD